MHKSCNNLWDGIRKKKEAKFEATLNNKKQVDNYNKKKVKELVSNKNKCDKAIEEHQRRVQHNIMLKQELRKLKEEDIMKVKERNKRLDSIKKNSIIDKQLKEAQIVDSIKRVKENIKKMGVEEDLKDLNHKDELAMTFLGVTKGAIDPTKTGKLSAVISQELLKPSEGVE